MCVCVYFFSCWRGLSNRVTVSSGVCVAHKSELAVGLLPSLFKLTGLHGQSMVRDRKAASRPNRKRGQKPLQFLGEKEVAGSKPRRC